MFVTFENANNDYEHYVVVSRIVRLSKSDDGEVTFVHLDNGEVIQSSDSMKTISARIKFALKQE